MFLLAVGIEGREIDIDNFFQQSILLFVLATVAVATL